MAGLRRRRPNRDAMPIQAHRTLVKSPPELWALLSDADSLGRRLEPFGEIRITRAEPESTVAWEGERARGTVEIQASGWGTRVTLTADAGPVEAEPAADAVEPVPGPAESEPEPTGALESEPAAALQPEPTRDPEPAPEPHPGFLVRLGRWLRGGREREDPPSAAAEPLGEPDPAADLTEKRESPTGREEPAPALPATSPVEPPPEVAEPGWSPAVEPEPSPEPVALPASQPAIPEPALVDDEVGRILCEVLDDLGAAHHRPFSRG